jgi:hypothetical protein
MTRTPSSQWELSIVLPLGVIAHQLMKAEEQLRLLNMQRLEVTDRTENARIYNLIEIKAEHIHRTLDSIRELISDIQTDLNPRGRKPYAELDD